MGWHPHVEVWLLVLTVGGGYLWALKRLGPRYVTPGEEAATPGQRRAFLIGVAVMWLASDWPIHELSETRLLSVHMTQHLLLTLVVPPLLMVGTPSWLARLLLPRPLLAIGRVLTKPFVALILFNAMIVITHWTVVVDASLRSEPVHFLVHFSLFFSALIMWTPVLSPLFELPRLHYPGQMLYLFAQSLLPTVPASFLTFGDTVIYRIYETFPRMGLSAIHDQQIGGLVMKLVGGAILWGVIVAIFFRWHAREEMEGSDAMRWQDVERELSRARSAGVTR